MRVLVHPEELGPDAPSQRILLPADNGDSASAASSTAEGVGVVGGTVEVRMLPLLSADMRTCQEMNAPRWVKVEEMAAVHEGALVEGVEQANVMATLVDLRNANVAGIAFENRWRVG